MDKENEDPGGHQGFRKNSEVRGADVYGILGGILGLLP